MTLKELLDSLTFDEIAPCCENHSFSDGNKRIAAMLFLWFMGKTAFFMEKMGISELPTTHLWL